MSDATWTLDGIDVDGRWRAVDGERSVRQALWTILLTRPGERVMRPEFGAGLERFIHQPNNATTRHLIAERVTQAIKRWEPRIHLDAVDVVSDPQSRTRVQVVMRYRLRQTGTPGELSLALEVGS